MHTMHMNTTAPDLTAWTEVKERGALTKTGKVYRSPDGGEYLRTGLPEAVVAEATFAAESFRLGFPVPKMTGSGVLPDGSGFFTEESAGEQNYGAILRADYESGVAISEDTFRGFSVMLHRFLQAQLDPANRQDGPSNLREGIQLANVLEENPDLDPSLFEDALSRAEARLSGMPLVLTHGDLTPYNVMEGGVIDFENRFVAPFGYDAVTAVTFQRFWDHPGPDGNSTMKRYEFTDR